MQAWVGLKVVSLRSKLPPNGCCALAAPAIPSGQGPGVTIRCLFCRLGLFTAACIGLAPRDEEDLEGELVYEKVAWLVVWPMNRLMIDRDAVVNVRYCIDTTPE
jgi:hypothetical protein